MRIASAFTCFYFHVEIIWVTATASQLIRRSLET